MAVLTSTLYESTTYSVWCRTRVVVEDDSFTRRIVLRVLRDLGYTSVLDTGSATSALVLFSSHVFDLIITDVNMPEMNGLELVQRIRTGKTSARAETRIVVLTSFSQSEVLASALALDINGFLVKPVIPAVVEAKLAQAVSERMHIHSPLAYEAVKTLPKSLSTTESKKSDGTRGSSIVKGEDKTLGNSLTSIGFRVALRRLRPGMMLKADIRLNDGTLILSAGHTLTELSINRLVDLTDLLPNHYIVIQDA